MSYGGGAARQAKVPSPNDPPAKLPSPDAPKKPDDTTASATWPTLANGRPDFEKMTSAQRRAFYEARLKRIFG